MSDEKPDLLKRLASARGKEIREAREALRWSQNRLAEEAGTSQQTIDRIERGEVGHSRALPAIRKVLRIPEEGFDPEKFDQVVEGVQKESALSYLNFMREGKYRSEIALGDKIPLYAPGSGQGMKVTNAIPRGHPVEYAEGAYGLIMFGSEMSPTIRNGEVAIVNPNLPPMQDSEVVVVIDGIPRIRTFIGETDEAWRVKQWAPEQEVSLSKDRHPAPESVVAKLSRST